MITPSQYDQARREAQEAEALGPYLADTKGKMLELLISVARMSIALPDLYAQTQELYAMINRAEDNRLKTIMEYQDLRAEEGCGEVVRFRRGR